MPAWWDRAGIVRLSLHLAFSQVPSQARGRGKQPQCLLRGSVQTGGEDVQRTSGEAMWDYWVFPEPAGGRKASP